MCLLWPSVCVRVRVRGRGRGRGRVVCVCWVWVWVCVWVGVCVGVGVCCVCVCAVCVCVRAVADHATCSSIVGEECRSSDVDWVWFSSIWLRISKLAGSDANSLHFAIGLFACFGVLKRSVYVSIISQARLSAFASLHGQTSTRCSARNIS